MRVLIAHVSWILILFSGCSERNDWFSPDYGLRAADKRLLVELSKKYSILRQVKIHLEGEELSCFDNRFVELVDATTERIGQLPGIDAGYSIATAIKEINQIINPHDPNSYRIPDEQEALAALLGYVDISGGISNEDCSEMAIFAYANVAPAASGQSWSAMRRGEPYEPSFNLSNAVANFLGEGIVRPNADFLPENARLSFDKDPYQWWVVLEIDTATPNGITEQKNRQKILELTSAFLDREDLLDTMTVLSIAMSNVAYLEMAGETPKLRAVFDATQDDTAPSASEFARRIKNSWRARDLVSENLSSTLVLARIYAWKDRKSIVDELRTYLSAIELETSTRILVFQPAF